ncbi:MAG TPA: DUF3592 domain-containing protein [Kofleriaceae bacterium]|jgi:hypothetical protein|nr:DUF3592 domain-containing protein [Kofleriaceae bacterium]
MVAIFILLIGVAAVVGGITLMSASRKARSWPVATGRITERSVGPSTTTGASRPGRYFEPRVTYDYTVAGKSYQGHRIGLATEAYDEDKARKVASELPDSVEVHYNPADPSDAVLQPSSLAMSLFVLIFGVIAVLVGGGMLLASFSNK